MRPVNSSSLPSKNCKLSSVHRANFCFSQPFAMIQLALVCNVFIGFSNFLVYGCFTYGTFPLQAACRFFVKNRLPITVTICAATLLVVLCVELQIATHSKWWLCNLHDVETRQLSQ